MISEIGVGVKSVRSIRGWAWRDEGLEIGLNCAVIGGCAVVCWWGFRDGLLLGLLQGFLLGDRCRGGVWLCVGSCGCVGWVSGGCCGGAAAVGTVSLKSSKSESSLTRAMAAGVMPT